MRMPARQDGIALVMVLAILLLLGISGAAAVQNAGLQLRLARNLQDSLHARQAAEAALVAAEAFLRADRPMLDRFHEAGRGGLWLVGAYPTTAPWETSGVWAAGSNQSLAVAGGGAVGAATPRFLIEWLGWLGEPLDADSEMSDAPAGQAALYRITARGFGPGRAVSQMQAIFALDAETIVPPPVPELSDAPPGDPGMSAWRLHGRISWREMAEFDA